MKSKLDTDPFDIDTYTFGIATQALRTIAEVGSQIATGAPPVLSLPSIQFGSISMTSDMQSITLGLLSRFDSQLTALQLSYSPMASAAAPFISTVQQYSGAITADGQYVVIDATARDGSGATLLDQLETLGLVGGASFGAMASGWMPVSQLGAMASLADLQFARESMMMSHAGSVTTQADHSLLSDIARGSFGVNGAGVMVGVISDSFNYLGGYSADISSGNLPAGVQILQDSGTTDEGRGMAQIVYDIAPGASLAFATAQGGQANFANNIIALANAGARVIVDDVSYFFEPMFQDGVIAQAIDQVVAAGVTYFSAAANNGHEGYEASFVAGSSQTINGRLETFHAFSSGNIFMPFTLAPGRTATVVLQWNQPAGSVSPGHASASDLDLLVTDNSASHVIVSGSIANNIGNDPIEGVQFTNNTGVTQTYNIVVGLVSGSVAPTDFRIVTFNGNGTVGNNFASNTNDGTIYGHAAAAGAIAVGAAYYGQTPAYGVNPPIVESYSSGGPTRILFDTAGNPVNQLRQGPAIVAPDGGNTSFFGGGDSDGDGFPNFFGTSAAAPAAAAVAALMLQLNPSLTPAQIRALLMNSAIDMDNPATAGFDVGFDYGTGAGLIQADKALQSVPVMNHAPVVTIPSVNVTATAGQVFATSSLFSVTDADNDALTYFLFDWSPAANSGHLVVNGNVVPAQTVIGLNAAQLAQTTFVAGSAGTDDLGVMAFDGHDYSGNTSFSPFHVTVPAVNHAPVVTIPSVNVTATAGQVFATSSLFSVTDADNDALTYFLFDWSPAANSGHLVVNGNVVPAQTVIGLNAAQLAQTTFVAGSAGTTDDLGVMAFDGHDYSGNTSFSPFHVNVPVANHAPVVTVPSANVTASAGQVFAASSLFSATDADNDALTYFLFDWSTAANSGHLMVNGNEVAAQTVIGLNAAQLANTTFVAGSAGTDDLGVMAFDGHDYSGNTSFSPFHVTVAGNHAPVVTIPSVNVAASAGQVFTAASLFSVTDADNDALTYFLFDWSPAANSGHLMVNGNEVPAQTVIGLNAAQIAQTTFVAGAAGTTDDLGVMAFDGQDYSGNTSFSPFHVLV